MVLPSISNLLDLSIVRTAKLVVVVQAHRQKSKENREGTEL
jgi:hypothetical protein